MELPGKHYGDEFDDRHVWHRECVDAFGMGIALVRLWLCVSPLAHPDAREFESVQSALTAVEQHFASDSASQWQGLLDLDRLRSACASSNGDTKVLVAALRDLTQNPAREKPAAVLRLQCELERSFARNSLGVTRSTPASTAPSNNLSSVAASILSRRPRADSDQPEANRHTVRQRLVALLATLATYTDAPSDRLARLIAEQLDVLSAYEEATPLVTAIRTYYGHPNLWIDISAELLDGSIRGEIDRDDPIDVVIMDTPVKGKGRVRALRELVIEPRSDAAVLRIVIEGTIESRTVAERGPARIKSHSLTSFRAEKPLVLTPEGLAVQPTICQAETQTLDSDVTSKSAGLRGWIVRRVGERRNKKLRTAADQQSSLVAQQRLLESIDREAEMLVKRLDRLALLPLALVSALTGDQRLTICSEGRVLRIGAVVGALGAPPVRPAYDDRQLFTIRLHDSLVRCRSTAAPEPSLSTPLAWQLAERVFKPRFTIGGVTLRDGNWGTILPVGFGEWLALEWRPAAPQFRMTNNEARRTKE